MKTRAVGGCAAAVLAALLACDISPVQAPPSVAAAAPAPPAREEAPVTAAAPPIADPVIPPPSSRVVLVTIDGARWEDVLGEREDVMPSLRRFVGERGVALGGGGCDHDVRASGPNFVSLPGYLELFTGHATTCTHNGCPPVESATVLDEARASAHRAGDVAVFASWGRYANAVARDRSAIVLSAGARGTVRAAKDDDKLRDMLEGGQNHAGYPGWGDYRPDVHTARIALRYLETLGPRLLVVGLGDADEQAHRGDLAGYRRALGRADTFLGDLDRTLVRMGERDSTTVLVTTDHGRAKTLRSHGAAFPESQRVFVAAYGAHVAHRGLACAASPLHLADVAGTLRALLADAPPAERGPLAVEILGKSPPGI